MHLFKSKSLIAFILCISIITAATFWSRCKDTCLPEAGMAWDVSGYYLYLPSIFYDDLGKVNKRNYIIDKYHPCGNDLETHPCANGNNIMKYASGMAVMYFPGFAAGHFAARHWHYPVDGFSYPYAVSMAFYSLLICIIGLWFMRKVLLLYFGDAATAIALIALCTATNYLNYSAIVSMLSHNYLFTIYALVIYLSINWYASPNYKKSAVLGLLCGLAALTRPTEIIIVLIPMLWKVDSAVAIKERLLVFKQNYPKVILFIACAFIVGSVQLIYWKIYTGHFLYWSYPADQGFNFLKVPVWHCLWSYKKGWFTYTPFMILSVLGFIPLYIKHKNIFWTILLVTFISLYITFSWKIWWYGGSFSQRAVIQYYTLLLFPVCAIIESSTVKISRSVLFAVFMVFCIWLNLIMTYQANFSYIMESESMSKAYYWKIFGKLNCDRIERRLIDCPEELPKPIEVDLKEIYKYDFNKDTSTNGTPILNEEKLQYAGNEKRFRPGIEVPLNGLNNGWFRAIVTIYLEDFGQNIFTSPIFYVALIDSTGYEIKRNYYHVQRVMDPKKWTDLPIDIYLPDDKNARKLTAGMCCYSDSIRVDIKDMRLLYAPEQK